MTAQLQKPPRLFTPEEYLRMERPDEYKSVYIKGRIYVLPGGTMNHSRIAGNVYRFVDAQLDGTPCCALTSDMRVRIPLADIYCYPDVSIVFGEPDFEGKRKDILLNPAVVVEVLSPSTKRYDVLIKLEQYSKSTTIREVAYVDQDVARVTHYTRNADNSWTTKIVEGLDTVLKFETIPVLVPLSDVYHRVTFEPETDEL